MCELIFKKCKLPAVILARLNEALERLNGLTGDHFSLVTFFLGKVLVLTCNDLMLVIVSNGCSPDTTTVVGLVAGARELLPGHIDADFVELCSIIGAKTDEEISEVRAVVSSKCEER